MELLANDPSDLQPRYGVVVIGSGYGGSIVAARLAMAGHSVCLLERGKEWVTGTFPDQKSGVLGQLRSDSKPLGLFDYHLGDDLDILMGNGLGGTSLINANVVIEPEDEVFQGNRWPAALRQDAADGKLKPFFKAVRDMLAVTDQGPPEGWPAKVKVMAQSAGQLGKKLDKLEVAVNLRKYDNQRNHVGVTQQLCTLCGDCVTGCNVGAKNTLYMNYLPLAKDNQAEIYVQSEVDYVVPASAGGYFVFYRRHDDGTQALQAVHATFVVLGAGVMGTTGILLRSRDRGLALSRRVGHYFSGNADLLGVGYNNDVPTDVLGFGDHQDARSKISVGPTILSKIDYRDRATLEKRFIVEEGAVPRAFVDALRRFGPTLALLQGRDTDTGPIDKARELGRALRDLGLGPPDFKGAANHTMLYLGMGHDGADGRIVLDHRGRPRVLWGALSERSIFSEISQEMYKIVESIGGTYIRNPRWTDLFGHHPITVHPLGGCPMGDDVETGVVNHYGQAFNADGPNGDELHPGLFVVDGSILPTSVGVNPLLTISALAERCAEHIIQAQPAPILPVAASLAVPRVAPPPVGLEFTEDMKGFFTDTIRDAATPEEYLKAFAKGRKKQSILNFHLTIILDDLQRFIESQNHEGRAMGYVEASALGGKCVVDEGAFNLFVESEQEHTKRMLYALRFFGPKQEKYRLDGFKEVRDDPGLDIWSDNTTLYTTLRKGWAETGDVLGQGVLYVQPGDFLKQLTTLRVRNSPNLDSSARWLSRFGEFFFGELWETFFRHGVASASGDAE